MMCSVRRVAVYVPKTKLLYEHGQQNVKVMIKYASSYEDKLCSANEALKSMVNTLKNISPILSYAEETSLSMFIIKFCS